MIPLAVVPLFFDRYIAKCYHLIDCYKKIFSQSINSENLDIFHQWKRFFEAPKLISYFEMMLRKTGIALGITLTGSGAGQMVIPRFIESSVSSFGLGNMMVMVGAAHFLLFISGFFLFFLHHK